MLFRRVLRLEITIAILSVAVASTLVVACSSSDDTGGGSGQTGTVPDAGSTPDDTGAAVTDAGEEAEAAALGNHDVALGGKCPNGDSDCISGHCISQGTGAGTGMGGGDGGGGGMGGTAGSFCSVPCATVNQNPAPECTDPAFTGKCSGKKLCQIK